MVILLTLISKSIPYYIMANINVDTIAKADLAGCLPIIENPDSFELLRDNLTMKIALCYDPDQAGLIRKMLATEVCDVQVPSWEYIINELQYELRIAIAHGVEHLSKDYESRLINDWAKHIIKMKDVDTSLDFISILKTNRKNRKRDTFLF
jgi:hypothetical protein